MSVYPACVSTNRRFLIDQHGEPFFWLADTAWELFHRLDRDATDTYLQDRADKGFTVIQAVVLAEMDGLRVPNMQGELPLVNEDPTQPNEAYFKHVDWAVKLANELGLCVAMLPTWGDKWNQKWGLGPEVFTPENAGVYGEWLGRRYKDAAVVWVVGGDRPVENDNQRAIVENMAAGLRKGDAGRHLITFHPCGQRTSSEFFHDAAWLDFNMWQTGHQKDRDNYNSITQDYNLQPTKPCLDAEPGYEDHPIDFKAENGYLNDADVRKSLYWSLFAGACGYTYGCHDIWQFWEESREGKTAPRTPWRDALNLPGSGQVQYARNLLEERAFSTRIPDQSLIVSENPDGPRHLRATRDKDGSFALIYFPTPSPATLDFSSMHASFIKAQWLNPRTGEMREEGFYLPQIHDFTPPGLEGEEEDWVLVCDASGL